LGDVLAHAQKPKDEAGIADPSQDPGLYFQYRADAIKAYKTEAGDRALAPAQQKAIAEMAASLGFDLQFWRQVVAGYVNNGWNPSNITGMIEYYERREVPPPTAKGKNGKGKQSFQSPPPPSAPVPLARVAMPADVRAEEEARLGAR